MNSIRSNNLKFEISNVYTHIAKIQELYNLSLWQKLNSFGEEMRGVGIKYLFSTFLAMLQRNSKLKQYFKCITGQWRFRQGGGSADINKRHPNVFCGMRTPQLVIRNKKVNIKPFISQKYDRIDL